MSTEEDIARGLIAGVGTVFTIWNGVKDMIDMARGGSSHRAIASRAVDLALDLVPVEELRELLDEGAIKRQKAIAEAAAVAKFGARG